LSPAGALTFVKEAENAMVPMLMERYGAAAGAPSIASRAARGVARREFGAAPSGEAK